MPSLRFEQALVYANSIHAAQRRKGTDAPYISHLLGVASLVIEHGGSEDQAIAALLHDAAEDQGGQARLIDIRARFGPQVADIVADCTDSYDAVKAEWRGRKEAYLAILGQKPATSLLVSLADKTHNAEAILNDWHCVGDEIWSRFTGGREGSHWYYRQVAMILGERLPGPLAQRLERAVKSFTA